MDVFIVLRGFALSLRNQIAILLIALSILFVISTYSVQLLVVMPAFVELERQEAVRDVHRCVDALARDLEDVSNIANDWSAWDDSYQYIQDHNETFAKVNLVDQAFSTTHVNLICLMDRNRRIVWGESRDMTTLEVIDVPDLFVSLQEDSGTLINYESNDDVNKGIVLTSKGPILLASRPLITTLREGPIQGSIIMGRFLDEREVKSLADRTHCAIEVWTPNQTEISQTTRRHFTTCSETGVASIEVFDEKTLHAYTVMNDVYNQPALYLRVSIPRKITAQGRISANVATGCSIAGGILTLFAVWGCMHWRIIGPLQRMASHAVRIGKQDDLKARLKFRRNDEIGTLANEFDEMVENLHQSRKKVLDTAHRAGMAEIASEVLHNVGNAVNSANCSVELLDERLNRSKVSGFGRASGLLREQAPRAAEFFGQDPRGPKLIDYLVNLNDSLQIERTDNQADVVRLRETVRHIRDAIAAQQTFAGRSNFTQEVELPALIDEVLQMNQELLRSTEVDVVIELPPLPELQLNKSKMIQVLVNLVRNAIQAMQGQPSDARRLTLSARIVEEDGLEIEVTDTGMGFEDDVLANLFTHGFTTKVDGNGFGLHYCANAIRESGGHITAQSAGSGQGATFRIRLHQVIPHVETVT